MFRPLITLVLLIAAFPLINQTTLAAPPIMFGEIGKEKQESEKAQQKQTAEFEQAGRRISEDDHSAQNPSSLASRTTLSEAQPKQSFSHANSSSASASSQSFSKTPQSPSLVTLVKAGVLAALFHLSRTTIPFAMAQGVHQPSLESLNQTAFTVFADSSPVRDPSPTSLKEYCQQRAAECGLSEKERENLFASSPMSKLVPPEFSMSCESLKWASNHGTKLKQAMQFTSKLDEMQESIAGKTIARLEDTHYIPPLPLLLRTQGKSQKSVLASFDQEMSLYIDQYDEALYKADEAIKLLKECDQSLESLPEETQQQSRQKIAEYLQLASVKRLDIEAAKKLFLATQYKHLATSFSSSDDLHDTALDSFQEAKEGFVKLHGAIAALEDQKITPSNAEYFNSAFTFSESMIKQTQFEIDELNSNKNFDRQVNQMLERIRQQQSVQKKKKKKADTIFLKDM